MARRNFNQAEQNIVDFWQENQIFQKSVEKEAPNGNYIFYDGPPFATGTPHYGHIVGSILKDVVPRYKTMQGYRVERKWGWDCHGLPIENLIEKELDLNSKKEIETLGVDKFNAACRSKVMMYAEEWKKVIHRLGRFVDMENDYKTMDTDFMESIWWVFKQLWEKDLIYYDYRAMHICPRCETTLSHSEVAQGYEMVKDLSVTAEFELVDEPGTYVLAWTTTPWTLPGNVALAMGADIEYVKVKMPVNRDENQKVVYKTYILAKSVFEKAKTDNSHSYWEKIGNVYNFSSTHPDNKSEDLGSPFVERGFVVEKINPQDLAGKKYKPLFPYYKDAQIENIENAYQIIVEDFVTAEDGTGIVHIAPGFGEDDFNAGKRHHLPFIQHVSSDGRFKPEVTHWAGQSVKPKENPMSADIEVVKYLAASDAYPDATENKLFAKEKYEHTYPHCWRCDSPLLNYSTGSWFVAVTKIKDRMLELAEQINWVPGHIKEGRFGNWLAGARDWAISRQRYWGSVMPIWQCDTESCQEQVVIGSISELQENSGVTVTDLHKDIVDEVTFACSCGGIMKRIPDVLDCWFESGSMPYAQMHYPFENQEKFLASFPAGYIAEGVDQTRAWFYYLHVLATAIMDKPAFKNVIVNGMILAEDGKKMSKRLQNYPDPMYIMERYGSDAMRLYMMTSPAVYAGDLNFSEKGVEETFRKVSMMWWNVFSFYEMNLDKNLLEVVVEIAHPLDIWMQNRLYKFVADVTDYMDQYEVMKASRLFTDFINDVSTWYVRRSRDRLRSDDQNDKAAALHVLHEVLLTASQVMSPVIPFLTEDIYLKLRKDSDPESIHLTQWPAVKDYNQKILDEMEQVRNAVELVHSIRSTQQIKVRQALQAVYITGIQMENTMKQVVADELNVKEVHIVDTLPTGDQYMKNEANNIQVALDTHLNDALRLEGSAREFIRQLVVLRKKKNYAPDDEIFCKFEKNDFLDAILEKFQEQIAEQAKITFMQAEESLGQDADTISVDGNDVRLKFGKFFKAL